MKSIIMTCRKIWRKWERFTENHGNENNEAINNFRENKRLYKKGGLVVCYSFGSLCQH